MKTDEMTFTTKLTVREIGRSLQDAFARAKAQSVEQIESSSGALASFDDRADIEVVASGSTLLGGLWSVQAYVVDKHLHREVLLVALGDGGFTRAWSGARNTTSLSASVKKRDEIGSLLR